MKHGGVQTKQTIGSVGEYLTAKFLKGRGYDILDINYRKPWGEIDIVCRKDDIVHFVEVKATGAQPSRHGYMPEDHVGGWKKQRLSRVIRTYLVDKRMGEDVEFQIDVVAIFLDFIKKKAIVRMVENVLLR